MKKLILILLFVTIAKMDSAQGDSCLCEASRISDVSLIESLNCQDERVFLFKIVSMHRCGRRNVSECLFAEYMGEKGLIRLDSAEYHEAYLSLVEYAEAVIARELMKCVDVKQAGQAVRPQGSPQDQYPSADRFYSEFLQLLSTDPSDSTLISIAADCERAYSWYFSDSRFLELLIFIYYQLGDVNYASKLLPLLQDETLTTVIGKVEQRIGVQMK